MWVYCPPSGRLAVSSRKPIDLTKMTDEELMQFDILVAKAIGFETGRRLIDLPNRKIPAYRRRVSDYAKRNRVPRSKMFEVKRITLAWSEEDRHRLVYENLVTWRHLEIVAKQVSDPVDRRRLIAQVIKQKMSKEQTTRAAREIQLKGKISKSQHRREVDAAEREMLGMKSKKPGNKCG